MIVQGTDTMWKTNRQEAGGLTNRFYAIYFYLISEDTNQDITCYYGEEEIVNITDNMMWKTYVVLSEMLIRILPCIILVCLNLAMINDFNVSVRRRQQLMATVFTISTSTIFSENSSSAKDLLSKATAKEDLQGVIFNLKVSAALYFNYSMNYTLNTITCLANSVTHQAPTLA